MRLDGRRLADLLDAPGRCRVALFHGDDAGLIRSCSDALVQAVAGSTDDPFRVVDLPRGSVAALRAEAAAAPLTGGRRVIRIRDAGEWVTEHARDHLAGPAGAMVVLEAGSLPSRSKLRPLIEASDHAACVACDPLRGRQLERALVDSMAARGADIDDDALRWVLDQLAPDQGHLEQTAETLAIYAGSGGRIGLAAAMACIGDQAGLSLDDALAAMVGGRTAAFDRALALAFQDGLTAVSAIRMAAAYLQRLLRLRGGGDWDPAPRKSTDPRWRLTGERLAFSLRALAAAELACKQTGAPAEMICRETLMRIAREQAG